MPAKVKIRAVNFHLVVQSVVSLKNLLKSEPENKSTFINLRLLKKFQPFENAPG